jgi:hypothetical protein
MTLFKNEHWLPVGDYETRYRISDLGNVFSIKAGRLLHPTPDNYGYLWVDLWNGVKRKRRKVHHLVLENFVGPCPHGQEALHGNDVKADNQLTNLRWGTRPENMKDVVLNGNHLQANKTRCPQGHKYSPENTDVRKYGRKTYRYCKQCQIDRGHRRVAV